MRLSKLTVYISNLYMILIIILSSYIAVPMSMKYARHSSNINDT